MSPAHGECKPSRTELWSVPAILPLARSHVSSRHVHPLGHKPCYQLPLRLLSHHGPSASKHCLLSFRRLYPEAAPFPLLCFHPVPVPSSPSQRLLPGPPPLHRPCPMCSHRDTGNTQLRSGPFCLLMLPWHHLADSRCQSPYRWPTRPSVTCPHCPSDLMATLAFVLQTKRAPASGSWQLLSPLPGMSFTRIPHCTSHV